MQPQDELENHGDVVKSILATVETMILPSLSATQFFQTNLFAFSPQGQEGFGHVQPSFLSGFLPHLVLPYLNLMDDPAASFVSKMTSKEVRHLWMQEGLGALVYQAHNRWRDQYLNKIRGAVDTFLKCNKNGGRSLKKAQEIFAATEAGSPWRLLFFRTSGVKGVLARVLKQQQSPVATDSVGESASAFLNQKSLRNNHSANQADRAFCLMVIRKHLLKEFGPKVQMLMVPSKAACGMQTLGRRPLLLPGLDPQDEVRVTVRVEVADEAYYHMLVQSLDMEDTLQELSVFLGSSPDTETPCFGPYSKPSKRKQPANNKRPNKRSRFA